MNKLNLGCGDDYKEGWINVDRDSKKADINLDLNKIPYPFEDNQFKEIKMSSILEHLNNPEMIMKEVHRIARPNAEIYIRVPHFSSINCWADIEHKRGYSIMVFRSKNLTDKFRVTYEFIEVPRSKFFIIPIVRLFPVFYEKHLAYIFSCCDIILKLEVIK